VLKSFETITQMSDTGPTGPTETGPTGPIETGPTGPTDTGPTDTGPIVIRLDDILSESAVLLQKETADAATLSAIGNPNISAMRSVLVSWAVTGFAGSVRVAEVSIYPPSVCSDGIARDLSEYIQFVSGKTIHEHLALLAEKLPDFRVAFVYMGSSIHFMVSKV
jgi:hypothetical protein